MNARNGSGHDTIIDNTPSEAWLYHNAPDLRRPELRRKSMSYADDMMLDQDFSQSDTQPMSTNPGRVKLQNVRCAFVNLIEPQAYQGKEKYNITLLIPKDDQAQVEAFASALKEIVNERWPVGGKITAKNQRPEAANICFQDGDTKEWSGYPGHWFVHATANPGYEPKVIDQLKRPIDKEGVIYGGCYVNAILQLWGWTHPTGGRGVSASILGVQFAKDGERFGSGSIDLDEFDELPISGDGLDELVGATGKTMKETVEDDPAGLPF